MKRYPNICTNLVIENARRYSRDEPTIRQETVNIPRHFGIACPDCGSTELVMTVDEHRADWGYFNGYRVLCKNCNRDPLVGIYQNLCDEYPELEPPTEHSAIQTFLTGERK